MLLANVLMISAKSSVFPYLKMN